MASLGVDFDDLDFVEELGLEENLDLHGQLDFGDRGITAFYSLNRDDMAKRKALRTHQRWFRNLALRGHDRVAPPARQRSRGRNERASADSPRPVICAGCDRYDAGLVGQSVEYGHHEQCLPTTASRSPVLSLSTAL